MFETGQAGFDEHGGGEGIPGEIAAGGDGIGFRAEEFYREPSGGVEAERFQEFEVGERDGDLIGGVEADEAEGPTGAEDGFEGKRIEVGVPFRGRGGGNVAGCIQGATHPYKVADGAAKPGLFAES